MDMLTSPPTNIEPRDSIYQSLEVVRVTVKIHVTVVLSVRVIPPTVET
jgi:hypothetical protein